MGGKAANVARRLCNLVAKHELFAEIAAELMLLKGAKLTRRFHLERDDFHDPALAARRIPRCGFLSCECSGQRASGRHRAQQQQQQQVLALR